MSINKMAETINIEEYLQLVSVQATECDEPTIPDSLSPSSAQEEEIFMRWTNESVKLLIALYQEHERKFADINYKNKSVWEIIAVGMREEGYCPTWVQCSNKWKQLKKSFVEVEDKKRATGRGKKTCKLYEELSNILDYKPGVNPGATASSSGKMEIGDAHSSTQEGVEEEEDVETQGRPSRRKRKTSGSVRSRSMGEAMLKFMVEYREEKRTREEKQKSCSRCTEIK